MLKWFALYRSEELHRLLTHLPVSAATAISALIYIQLCHLSRSLALDLIWFKSLSLASVARCCWCDSCHLVSVINRCLAIISLQPATSRGWVTIITGRGGGILERDEKSSHF